MKNNIQYDIRRGVVPAIILLFIVAHYLPLPEAVNSPWMWSKNFLVMGILGMILAGVGMMLVAYLVSLLGHKSQRLYPQIYLVSVFAIGAILILTMTFDSQPWLTFLLDGWGVVLAFLSWKAGRPTGVDEK